jgi:hypothetical protein
MIMSVVRYFLCVERLPALAVHTKAKPVRNVAQIRASSIYHEPTFPSRHGALYLRETLAYATVLLTSLPADLNIIILSPPLPPQKSSSSFLLSIITLIITFITTLTILLSARHVHEIGILALQVDESIVMKLMMSSKECGVMMDIL